MANNDAPFGFVPYRHLSGGIPGRTNDYTIASEYNASIFTGDLVKSDGGAGIVVAGEGDQALGVFQGCSYVNAAGEQVFSKYWPADTVATNIVAHVIDDPMMTFKALAEGSIVAADVGLFADMDNSQAGNTALGISGMAVGAHDGSEGGLKILRILEEPILKAGAGTYPNDGAPGLSETGNYALVEVRIIEHALGGAAPTET